MMGKNETKDLVPRDVLAKQGISSVTNLAGGVFLLVMTIGARFRIMGIVLSLGALVVGIGALFSKDREDKKPGLFLTAAGILGMVFQFGIPMLKPFAGFILGLGGFALLASGLWKGIKFLLGIKNRQERQ